MEEQNKARVKLIVALVIIFLVGVVGYKLYINSMENDFNDISTVEIERVGDHYTGQFHRPDCPKAKKILEPVIFEDGATAKENNKQAREEGYVPCKRCHPEKLK